MDRWGRDVLYSLQRDDELHLRDIPFMQSCYWVFIPKKP